MTDKACENCRFAVIIPVDIDKIQQEIDRLQSKIDERDRQLDVEKDFRVRESHWRYKMSAMDAIGYLKHRLLDVDMRICQRYPKEERNSKNYWCGEWQSKV